MEVILKRRLFGPDRLTGAQLGRPDQMPVHISAEHQIALAEAMFGVMRDEIVGHAAAEALVARIGVEPQHMITELRCVRHPQTTKLRLRQADRRHGGLGWVDVRHLGDSALRVEFEILGGDFPAWDIVPGEVFCKCEPLARPRRYASEEISCGKGSLNRAPTHGLR